MPSLLLASLHPDGPGGGVCVREPGTARPLGSELKGVSRIGVAVLAPTTAERRDRRWVRELAAELDSAQPDAVVVLAGASRALRRDFATAGFLPVARLLHLPHVLRSRQVFPLRGRAADFARARLFGGRPLKASAVRALAMLPPLAASTRTSELLARPGTRPPFDWLAQLDPPVAACTAIASTSGRPNAAAVLLRFSSSAQPDLVVKVGGQTEQETRGLSELAGEARAAGASVPEPTWSGHYGAVPVLAETVVAGESALGWVSGSSERARQLAERVAEWLQRWNARSAQQRPLSRAMLERLILEPGASLSPAIGVPEYWSRLERLCDACEGRILPLVAAHNDLTAANLLLEAGNLGVLDWEQSAAEALPLGDLAYAIADAAAAVDGYRNRPAAFDACFDAGGSFARLTRRLITLAVRAHGLDAQLVELCLHACWLGHAANELRRSEVQESERPFLEILRRVAMRSALWQADIVTADDAAL